MMEGTALVEAWESAVEQYKVCHRFPIESPIDMNSTVLSFSSAFKSVKLTFILLILGESIQNGMEELILRVLYVVETRGGLRRPKRRSRRL
jgi:hypothetical protein